MLNSESDLDLKAFNVLFERYQQRFIRFASTYVSDRAVSEDIVMESFSSVWERRSTLSVAAFPAYTLTIVKNKCMNHLRAGYVRAQAADNIKSQSARVLATQIATLQACDPEELFSKETRKLVDDAIAALPPRTREIFIRSRIEEQTYKQISEQMGITVKSVEFEISKAMKLLKVSLKDYFSALIFLLIIN